MFHSIAFKIVFSIISQNKQISLKNGIIYSNINDSAIGEEIKRNKQELLQLLTNIPVKTLKSLHELYEERAGIIEYDGEYAKEVAEKLALQDVIGLLNGVSNDTVLSYKESTKKLLPYWIPNKILKGIDIESSKAKTILNEVKNCLN